jgi:ubiquinone/menaquinone biosynthesis C-methylase UbiE
MLQVLRCPVTREPLHYSGGRLVGSSRAHEFRVTESGIALFAERFCSAEGRVQQEHYDRIAAAYLEHLAYPHTQAYTEYLDAAFLKQVQGRALGRVAEICCGRGEAFHLLGDRVTDGLGIDVSLSMLEAARRELPGRRYTFAQADATMLPVADDSLDHVVMFGGIHHVPDRRKLFAEIERVLKPGGLFLWREPVSDFFLWRWLRAIIYRLAPALDHETERPLRYRETVPLLEEAGMQLRSWETFGFAGFCIFMNSDVLVFNRAFKFVPGIRAITRLFAKIDDLTVRLPGMRHAGLQVVGVAAKPAR